jgi:hypothetical protein
MKHAFSLGSDRFVGSIGRHFQSFVFIWKTSDIWKSLLNCFKPSDTGSISSHAFIEPALPNREREESGVGWVCAAHCGSTVDWHLTVVFMLIKYWLHSSSREVAVLTRAALHLGY